MIGSSGNKPGKKLLIGSLALAVGGLAAANFKLASIEIDTSPILHQRRDDPGRSIGPIQNQSSHTTKPLEDYPETTARPLFSPNRRPPPPPGPETAPEPPLPEPDDLRLVGLMQSGPGVSRALVRAGNLQGRWVSAGDEIDGWTVSRIGGEAVTLQAGTHTYELRLFRRSTAPGG